MEVSCSVTKWTGQASLNKAFAWKSEPCSTTSAVTNSLMTLTNTDCENLIRSLLHHSSAVNELIDVPMVSHLIHVKKWRRKKDKGWMKLPKPKHACNETVKSCTAYCWPTKMVVTGREKKNSQPFNWKPVERHCFHCYWLFLYRKSIQKGGLERWVSR